MVGNNQSFGQGMVLKWLPTNVGQPTIRVKALTVGGRKGENRMKYKELVKIFKKGKEI